MADTYGRFAAIPIGPMLAARDGGLSLATTGATDLKRVARSDFALDSGNVGVEFAAWGDDDLSAMVGFCNASAPLDQALGSNFAGIGWELATGRLLQGIGAIATDLPRVAKGDIVGLRVSFGSPNRLYLYLNGALVHQRDLLLEGPLYFAVSVASTKAGGLYVIVNAGQWGARCDAAAAGWTMPFGEQPGVKLADADWLSAPGDSPANTRYEGIIVDGINIVSELTFWPWGGDAPAQASAAQCVAADADGVLDALALSGTSGVPVRIMLADEAQSLADASPALRCTLDHIEINDDGTKTLHMRDAHAYLDQPLNRGVFLPNIAALAWKPQPLVIGAVASVPALGANSDATAMFIGDGRLYVDAVLDRGHAMEPGTYGQSPDGQQLVMKSPPVMPVVVDASSVGPGQEPATLRQAVTEIMERLGQGAWSSADCAAIDAATGYSGIGYYAGGQATGRDALNAILASYGVGSYQDPDGVLRFVRVVAPESYEGAMAFDLGEADMATDLVSVPDDAPNLTRRLAYRPNGQALGASDLVTDLVGLPQPRRDELMGLYRGQAYGAGPVHPHYRRVDSADPVLSLFWHAVDAQREVDRVLSMYQEQRFFYQVAVRGDQQLMPLPGQIGRLSYGRYGLQDGKPVLVRRVERNPATGDVAMVVWG